MAVKNVANRITSFSDLIEANKMNKTVREQKKQIKISKLKSLTWVCLFV